MTIENLNDGCTAGPLSDLLNSAIRLCCDAHDKALDHTYDIGTFITANLQIAGCVLGTHYAWLAMPVFVAVSGPIGLFLYYFGKKQQEPPANKDGPTPTT